MDWTTLIGPAVVAAVISGLVSSVGIWVSARNARIIHSEKLAFDRELSERKVNADIILAEKKFLLDAKLSAWKRRYELCEQVLTCFYQAREVLLWARTQVIFKAEGESREVEGQESDKLRRKLNLAYVPIERLNREREVFAKLQTLRLAFTAHFGSELSRSFDTVAEAHSGIMSAASVLMQTTTDDGDEVRGTLSPVRDQLWGPRPDDMDRKIDKAVTAIETACKPVLAGKLDQ